MEKVESFNLIMELMLKTRHGISNQEKETLTSLWKNALTDFGRGYLTKWGEEQKLGVTLDLLKGKI